ncbi:hypothetical protein CHRY9293_02488 [Chryseobacterium potabilaquae]|uniref:Uncharacterized protein n=1 Tax=Chryseobacterium potabilaquae TaxID=2675057 RepID=A0A6N4X6R6_9FLAO|nr:hypothetical protein CHRY9293_02488 [Chryseobacterium potabilaquae]
MLITGMFADALQKKYNRFVNFFWGNIKSQINLDKFCKLDSYVLQVIFIK